MPYVRNELRTRRLGYLALTCLAGVGSVVVFACSGASSGPLGVSPCGPGTTMVNGLCVVVDAATPIPDGSFPTEAGGPSDAGLEAAAPRPVVCPHPAGTTEMVGITVDGGPSFCIDATEVTNAQYKDFLDAMQGDASGQTGVCAANTSNAPKPSNDFLSGCKPPPYDPINHPQHPIACINWCDAQAYCAWAQKRLCGAVNGDPSPRWDAGTPPSAEWLYACTAAGTSDFPVPNPAACNLGNTQPGGHNASRPVGPNGCSAPDAPFASIFDLIGNVSEWQSERPSATRATVMGSSFATGVGCDPKLYDIEVLGASGSVGTRCCAAPVSQ